MTGEGGAQPRGAAFRTRRGAASPNTDPRQSRGTRRRGAACALATIGVRATITPSAPTVINHPDDELRTTAQR
eukprot:gene6078-4006_t